jgi:hypothetical protein
MLFTGSLKERLKSPLRHFIVKVIQEDCSYMYLYTELSFLRHPGIPDGRKIWQKSRKIRLKGVEISKKQEKIIYLLHVPFLLSLKQL